MQQTQVIVVNQVQVGLRTSAAVFPGCMPMTMRMALSLPIVLAMAAVSATMVVPTATGPK